MRREGEGTKGRRREEHMYCETMIMCCLGSCCKCLIKKEEGKKGSRVTSNKQQQSLLAEVCQIAGKGEEEFVKAKARRRQGKRCC